MPPIISKSHGHLAKGVIIPHIDEGTELQRG